MWERAAAVQFSHTCVPKNLRNTCKDIQEQTSSLTGEDGVVWKSALALAHFHPCWGQESGNCFLVHTEPSRGQILSFQMGKGGKTTGDQHFVGFYGTCATTTVESRLIAQPFSDFTPSSLRSLWNTASPCPSNWDFSIPQQEDKKITFFRGRRWVLL